MGFSYLDVYNNQKAKEEISNKKTVENSIMKKLGYKKQKGIWIATKNYYKYPNELYY